MTTRSVFASAEATQVGAAPIRPRSAKKLPVVAKPRRASVGFDTSELETFHDKLPFDDGTTTSLPVFVERTKQAKRSR